jgi:cytosine/uracil/thiamine/allantoin permease
MEKIYIGLLIICIIFVIMFSANVVIEFIPMNNIQKILSIAVPSVIGFVGLPIVFWKYGRDSMFIIT